MEGNQNGRKNRTLEGGLVSENESAPSSHYVLATRLNEESGKWVQGHTSPISITLPQSDGNYIVYLRNGTAIPVDRNDGLDILDEEPK